MKLLLQEGIDFTPLGPNARGSYYTELYQAIPLLQPFYMKWETNYNPEPLADLMKSLPIVPTVAVILYVIAIFGGQAIMRRYERFDLRYPLAYWNLLLSAFSFMGMVRIVPHFIYLMSTRGFHTVACGHPEPLYGNGAVGFWVQAFIVSKLFELVDTAFIVLRKRNLMFLHWYHHVTVLLFTWFCYTNENPGIIFVAMNYSVHAVMYGYYYLEGLKMRPAWLQPQFITVAQISQMVVGVSVAAYYMYQQATGGTCAVDPTLLAACGVMYSTYLYLFASFFGRRFFSSSTRTQQQAAARKKPKAA